MHAKYPLLFFVALIAKCESSRESQCIDYYSTGNNFDLSTFSGLWYAVYFWPPNIRQRDRCEAITFRSLARGETDALRANCPKTGLSAVDNALHSSYTNSAGKLTNIIYYGNGEVKSMYRSCDKISKYIFLRINNKYVMGINCSAGGRGVLLAQSLTTAAEVNSVVQGLQFMEGREGSPDCPLPA